MLTLSTDCPISLKSHAAMFKHQDCDVKLSVEETCPHPSAAQCRTGDFTHTTCCGFLDRCVGMLVCALQRCLRATRARVLCCCCCNESVEHDVDVEVTMPVQESTPSQISVQPRSQNDEMIRAMRLQLAHDFIRTVPIYPWADIQAD